MDNNWLDLLKNRVYQSDYKANSVLGIKDIMTKQYQEAVNIVIKIGDSNEWS